MATGTMGVSALEALRNSDPELTTRYCRHQAIRCDKQRRGCVPEDHSNACMILWMRECTNEMNRVAVFVSLWTFTLARVLCLDVPRHASRACGYHVHKAFECLLLR